MLQIVASIVATRFNKCLAYSQLLVLLASMRLRVSLAYRANIIFWTIISVCWTFFNFFFFFLLTSITGDLGGWSLNEVYVLVGVFTILDALIWSWLYDSMANVTRSIYEGTLDFLLIKPVDSQFMLSFSHIGLSNSMRLLLGIAVLIKSVQATGLSPSLLDWMLFVILFLCGVAMFYSFWLSVACLSFFADRLESIHEIFPGIRRLMEVPSGVYQGAMATIVTVIVPISLITNVPAESLLGSLDPAKASYFLFFTVFTLLASRKWYQFCVRRYSGIGS